MLTVPLRTCRARRLSVSLLFFQSLLRSLSELLRLLPYIIEDLLTLLIDDKSIMICIMSIQFLYMNIFSQVSVLASAAAAQFAMSRSPEKGVRERGCQQKVK